MTSRDSNDDQESGFIRVTKFSSPSLGGIGAGNERGFIGITLENGEVLGWGMSIEKYSATISLIQLAKNLGKPMSFKKSGEYLRIDGDF